MVIVRVFRSDLISDGNTPLITAFCTDLGLAVGSAAQKRCASLVYVHRFLKLHVFISEFVRFILGNDTAPETETTAQSEQHRLRR